MWLPGKDMIAPLVGLFFCLILVVPKSSAHADECQLNPASAQPPAAPARQTTSPPAVAAATIEFDHELDPYYSNISLSFPLTDTCIPEVTESSEVAIYGKLFQNILKPRFVLLEAAVFPMPLLGVGTRKYAPDFYRSFNVGNRDLNLFEAVTAGFQEPYAVSLFFGDVVNFVKPGAGKSSSNRGYMGYLFSYSNQHIKRNVLIPDHNLETEWKLKGDRIFAEDKLSWSFRVGSKLHSNPDISDTVYLGFRRSNLDFKADILSVINNSSFDFRWDFSMKDGRPLRQEYTIGKRVPLKNWHVALKLDVGFIWENPENYHGRLHNSDHQDFVAIIRPNIDF
jgi:hypothetical protein